MAAEDVEQIATLAPSYHSNLLSFSLSSFNADLEQALLEHLTPLRAYTRDGTYAPPNTPEEKKDDVVVIVESKKVETQRQTEDREERDHEDPWFTTRCIILALISCVALAVWPCAFALCKVTGPH